MCVQYLTDIDLVTPFHQSGLHSVMPQLTEACDRDGGALIAAAQGRPSQYKQKYTHSDEGKQRSQPLQQHRPLSCLPNTTCRSSTSSVCVFILHVCRTALTWLVYLFLMHILPPSPYGWASSLLLNMCGVSIIVVIYLVHWKGEVDYEHAQRRGCFLINVRCVVFPIMSSLTVPVWSPRTARQRADQT